MRSLNQCRDEVFRRGKEKIRQRRRRTVGIVVACVPLVAGLLLLQIPKEENKTPENISMQQMSASDADGLTSGSGMPALKEESALMDQGSANGFAGTPELKEECEPTVADRNMDFSAVADEESEAQFEGRTWQWTAQYVRADRYMENALYPQVQVADSLEKLNTYDGFDRIADACTGYDETFFKDRFLVMVLLQEYSGSITHEVLGVKQTAENKTAISIKRIVPQVCTNDMAQWHIIVELKRDVPVKSAENVQVYLDERLTWDGQYVAPPKPEAQFKAPPEIRLRSAAGDLILKPAGYSWTYENPDGSSANTTADQTARPLPVADIKEWNIDLQYAETIYLPVPGSTVYEPTDSLGYFIKLDCPGYPASISFTKWVDGERQQVLGVMEHSFYAEVESAIYEIAVSWTDEQAGYFGSANYYVYIDGSYKEVQS